MLVHKGGQINNVQLITGEGSAQMSHLKNCSVKIFKEHCRYLKKIKTRIDVYETLCPQQMFVHKGGKIKKWGGKYRGVTPTKSLSQNIREDVNREVKFL